MVNTTYSVRLVRLLLVILSLLSYTQAFTFPSHACMVSVSMRGNVESLQHQNRGQVKSFSMKSTKQVDTCFGDGLTYIKARKMKKLGTTSVASVIITLLIAKQPAIASPSSIISDTSDILATSLIPASSYHLTRILFLRLLAVVYIAAFSVAKHQNKGLIGDNGISPARNALNEAELRGKIKCKRRREWLEERKKYTSSPNTLDKIKNYILDSKPANIIRDKFWYRTDRMERPLPTLLWFARDRNKLNHWLDGLANIGLFLSAIMLATGCANVFQILSLYLIQRSFMSVGGVWYGYGWEPQLAELTFHALFLVPLFSLDPFFGLTSRMGAFPVPTLIIWMIRFYLFKIMLGAGLIKIKSSDRKWKPGNMSAMDFFYETQPVPNPFSRMFHNAPKAWHRVEVWMNHFVELIAPFFLLMPHRETRIAGGLIQISFQVVLISSGNLSFLNWLTIVPAIFCLDDAFLMNSLPSLLQKVMIGTPAIQSYIKSITSGVMILRHEPILRSFVSIVFFLSMAKLNIPVIRNLLARRQVMNASFDRLRLAGTYGAFGVVAEQREELIIEAAHDIQGPWKEFQFKVKPGDVNRRPRWISPYHYRLDWQLWIASQSGSIERNPWLVKLLLKLLRKEKDVLDLIERDPWENDINDPRYIRIEKYKYQYYDPIRDASDGRSEEKPFWKRERIGKYFPRQGILTADMLQELVDH